MRNGNHLLPQALPAIRVSKMVIVQERGKRRYRGAGGCEAYRRTFVGEGQETTAKADDPEPT